jgi:DNA mismatch repair protein MutL
MSPRPPASVPDPRPQTPHPAGHRASTVRIESTTPAPGPTTPFRVLGQAGGSYIVLEDDLGVKLIDQHALHERILFEQLLARAASHARGDAQGLLVPDQIDLSPVQAAVFHQDQTAVETLKQIGFDVEVSSARVLSVLAVPTIIKRNAAAAVRDLLDALGSSGDDAAEKKPLSREHLREKAAYILSCKGAIKAGERLTIEQMTALMIDFKKITGESGFTCPHGRPLALELSWHDIEKAVDRA